MSQRHRGALDRHVVLGLASIVAVVAIVVIVMGQFLPRVFSSEGDVVEAEFATTGQLREGDPVRVKGVEVGKVKEMELQPGGRSAIVRMSVDDEGRPLYRNARAALRWRLLLGGALAVDLDPGSPSAGRLDGRIPVNRTQSQVELDELMTAVGGKAARGTRLILRELPEVVRDPEAPRQALHSVAETAPALGRAAHALRGRRDGDLAALIRASARTVRAIDAPTAPVRDVVEGATATFQATARRTQDLQRTLEVAPRALRRADRTLTRLRSTLDVADPLLARLTTAAGAVAPSARQVRPLLTGADRLLRDAEPALRSLRPAVSDLAVTGREGAPLLEDLQPTLTRLDQSILPALGAKDEVSGRTSAQMIGPVLSGITLGRFDSEGHFFTLGVNPGPGLGQSGALCDPFKAAEQLRVCESFVDLLTGQTGPRSTP